MEIEWVIEDWVGTLAVCPITRFTATDISSELDILKPEVCEILSKLCERRKINFLPGSDEGFEVSQNYKKHCRQQTTKQKFAR